VTVILVIDRAGARQIKELIPDALTVWLTVPSLDELRRRLETRARDSQEQIERRLEIAKRELEEEKKYQFYAYSIENSKKESTIIALENMIVESIKSSI
jgi:guanylate kinase